ncbi:hypothetical protein ABH926_007475 [Catenulispora sp. GP43]|uniref:hypothetical protein n=1 Tax=Catenulispora sp. GP43 TaxID=3156263 RepID=UPI003515FD28
MTGFEVLTAGRYGYADRRIHRDDFAHQLAVMLPADDDERLRPAAAVTADDLVSAAKLCRHLAERYPGEPLARLAEQIAYRLEHPITHPGAMVYYAAALLCREQEALSRVESATMVAAVLEARAAGHTADALEATAPQTLRYTVKTAIDGDFVRGARHLQANSN